MCLLADAMCFIVTVYSLISGFAAGGLSVLGSEASSDMAEDTMGEQDMGKRQGRAKTWSGHRIASIFDHLRLGKLAMLTPYRIEKMTWKDTASLDSAFAEGAKILRQAFWTNAANVKHSFRDLLRSGELAKR